MDGMVATAAAGGHEAGGGGDPYAAVPALGAAVAAAGRAGRDLRAMREAREDIDGRMRDLLEAAQRDGRTLSEGEARAFDAAGDVADGLAGRERRAAADTQRAARFAVPLEAAAGSRDRDAPPADPFNPRGGDPGRAGGGLGLPGLGGRRQGAGSGTRFRFAGGRVVAALRAGERLEDHVRAAAGARGGAGGWAGGEPAGEPDLGLAVRALLTGDLSGVDDVTRSALGEGFSTAGGYLVPASLSAQVLDLAREQSAVFRAGAQLVPIESGGVHVIATVVRDPEPAWRPEHGEIVRSQPAFGQLVVAPRSLGCIVPISLELLADAPNISDLLRSLLGAAFAAELDRAALAGAGTAAEPTGVVNSVHVSHMLAAGDDSDRLHPDMLARMLWGVRAAGAAGPLAAIAPPGHLLSMDVARTPDGKLLERPKVLDDLALVPSGRLPQAGSGATLNAPVVVGDFSQLVVFLRERLTIEFAREASPEFSHGQVAIRALMRADVAVLQPRHLIVREGVRWAAGP